MGYNYVASGILNGKFGQSTDFFPPYWNISVLRQFRWLRTCRFIHQNNVYWLQI